MKNASRLLLLPLLLLQSGGILLFCVLLQLNQQHKATKLLENPETRLVTIIISKKDFDEKRVRHDEVRIDGKMYDIKRSTLKDGVYELLAYHDKEEDDILTLIENYFSPENHNDFSLQVIKFITSVFLIPVQNYNPENSSADWLAKAHIQEFPLTLYPDRTTPPPEIPA